MSANNGKSIIEYGDIQHPKFLLKVARKRKKSLRKFMKGRTYHLSQLDREFLLSKTLPEISEMIDECDREIKAARSLRWMQGSVTLKKQREGKRYRGKIIGFRKKALFVDTQMNAFRNHGDTSSKDDEKPKKF